MEVFIFTGKALTIINHLLGLDTEWQHKENWQRRGAFVPHITHPSIPDSMLTPCTEKKKQHNTM